MGATKPEGLRIIDPKAVRVIVCTKCNAVVAEDLGRPIDAALIALAVRNHLNPPIKLEAPHEIVTAFIGTDTCVSNVCLDEKSTKIM